MQPTYFQLLGPVAVFHDGREIDIGSPKQRIVLSILLASAGRPVPTPSLMERLWGEELPRTARNALYTYVAQLRSSLASLGLKLDKQRNGYILRVDPRAVDLHRFQEFIAVAKRGAEETDELDSLVQALELYCGEPLDGLSGPWVDTLRAGLAAERRWALIRRNHILLRQGRPAEILGELGQAAKAQPLDELLAEQLIVALYCSGQRAAALCHYHQVRSVLVEELGVDPGPSLRAVYQQLLEDKQGAPRRAMAALQDRRDGHVRPGRGGPVVRAKKGR
jgi:DNA-binding SARP family transcriptional activator